MLNIPGKEIRLHNPIAVDLNPLTTTTLDDNHCFFHGLNPLVKNSPTTETVKSTPNATARELQYGKNLPHERLRWSAHAGLAGRARFGMRPANNPESLSPTPWRRERSCELPMK
jgi:hypothetical protein